MYSFTGYLWFCYAIQQIFVQHMQPDEKNNEGTPYIKTKLFDVPLPCLQLCSKYYEQVPIVLSPPIIQASVCASHKKGLSSCMRGK